MIKTFGKRLVAPTNSSKLETIDFALIGITMLAIGAAAGAAAGYMMPVQSAPVAVIAQPTLESLEGGVELCQNLRTAPFTLELGGMTDDSPCAVLLKSRGLW